MEMGRHMLSGKALGTFFNDSKVKVEILGDILNLDNGDVVLPQKVEASSWIWTKSS